MRLLLQHSVRRRTLDVPMVCAYVRVHVAMECLTAQTVQTNSTAVSIDNSLRIVLICSIVFLADLL